jgi:hypothetical protein
VLKADDVDKEFRPRVDGLAEVRKRSVLRKIALSASA